MRNYLKTDEMTYHRVTKTFVVEASSIPHLSYNRVGGTRSGWSFDLVSSKTGKVVLMYHAGEERTKDFTVFRPMDMSLDFEVHILND